MTPASRTSAVDPWTKSTSADDARAGLERIRRAVSAGCPPPLTRQSACATSSPHSCFCSLGGVEALLMRLQLARPEQHLSQRRQLQPDLHDARHDDDVSLRRARDGRHGHLSGAADARDAQRRLPAAERLRLLDVSGRRASSLRRRLHQHRSRRRLVCLSAALRPAVFARQGRGCLGADDHVHGDLGAVRGRRTDRHHSSRCARRACR